MEAPECLGAYLWVKGNTANDILSREELRKALNLACCNPLERALDMYWKQGNGRITYEDFTHILDKEQMVDTETLVRAFVKLGGSHDGYISYKTLIEKLQTGGEALGLKEIHSLRKILKPDENGKVNFLQVCATLSLALRQCYHVTEMKAEQEAQLHRINSRTYTRKKAHKTNGVDSLDGSLRQPADIHNWLFSSIRGCFFAESTRQISSHSYTLNLQEDSPVWITIKPIDLQGNPPQIDTELLIFGDGENSGRPLGCTSHKEDKITFAMGLNLQKGNYLLVPFTTGSHPMFVRQPVEREVPLVARNNGNGSPVLTPLCVQALEEIFHYSDLDCNGLLSRKEFDLFCLRTSGEAASDEEWAALQAHFSTQDGQLTVEGFIALHEMELMENRGNTHGLRTSLSKMGYNRALVLDQAYPFLITVYTMRGSPVLGTLPVSEKGGLIDKALCRLAVERGVASKVKNMNDLTLHVFQCAHRATIAVRNKSHSTVSVKLDCSGSSNCISHRKSLDHVVDVPPRSCVIGHHLLPKEENLPWTASCQETLIK